MADLDYYQILGISKNATEKEIKSAFRKKAATLHPDKNKDPKAPEEFKKVNEAYQVLSDPQKRRAYDQFGSAAFQNGYGGSQNGGFGGANGFEFDFSDMFGGGGFNSIFGDDNPLNDLFGGGRSRENRNQGSDINLRIQVTLEDVIKGPEKEIQYSRKTKCNTCKGSGGSKVDNCSVCKGAGKVSQVARTILGNMQVVKECPECKGTGKKVLEKCTSCNGESVLQETRNFKIRIPGGIESGMNIRFQEEGNAGLFGTKYGDLFIEVDILKDDRFVRQGSNLIHKLNLPVYSLLLGDEVNVFTFDGNKLVKIPAGIQVGEKLALKGLGIPDLRTKKRGDIILEISIEIPKKLSKEERELFEKLRDLNKNKKKGFFNL